MEEKWKGSDWWQIRLIRTDITDYVIHRVNEEWESGSKISCFSTLLKILGCGYLKPTFAMMPSSLSTSPTGPTIKGSYPAVCFTEQPLECFITSCEYTFREKKRYFPYGIVLHKWPLFEYGGRPVIYGDESILERLPKEFQYLWVRYSPIPSPKGYPIDFTHEREWRAKVNASYHKSEGYLPKEGIPIFLPPVAIGGEERKYSPSPYILVQKKEEKETLIKVVEICWPDWKEKCQNEYLKKQFDRYPEMKIIALEEVKRHLEAGEREWARLETLPL